MVHEPDRNCASNFRVRGFSCTETGRRDARPTTLTGHRWGSLHASVLLARIRKVSINTHFCPRLLALEIPRIGLLKTGHEGAMARENRHFASLLLTRT